MRSKHYILDRQRKMSKYMPNKRKTPQKNLSSGVFFFAFIKTKAKTFKA